MNAIISNEYRADIAAVQADPIAIAMAEALPAGIEITGDLMIPALREYRARGGVHGTTHMGAVAEALRNLRA